MMEVLRLKVEHISEKWLAEIRNSSTKSTLIDITTEFENLNASNMIHIAFGGDINDQVFDF